MSAPYVDASVQVHADLKTEACRRRKIAFTIKSIGIVVFFLLVATFHTPSTFSEGGAVSGSNTPEAFRVRQLNYRVLLDERTTLEFQISCDAVNEQHDVCSFVEVRGNKANRVCSFAHPPVGSGGRKQ
jgi:hypothetical protein